jgi:hypothetical protein
MRGLLVKSVFVAVSAAAAALGTAEARPEFPPHGLACQRPTLPKHEAVARAARYHGIAVGSRGGRRVDAIVHGEACANRAARLGANPARLRAAGYVESVRWVMADDLPNHADEGFG